MNCSPSNFVHIFNFPHMLHIVSVALFPCEHFTPMANGGKDENISNHPSPSNMNNYAPERDGIVVVHHVNIQGKYNPPVRINTYIVVISILRCRQHKHPN